MGLKGAQDLFLNEKNKVSYLSNQGFLEGRPPSWETGGLFLESDSITIRILLLGILSGERRDKD